MMDIKYLKLNNMKYKIVISLIALCGFNNLSAQLNDNNATKETKALYSNLQQMQGKSILFGHQDDTAYGIAWKYEKEQSDVKKVSGDYPSVYGWDLGHIELNDSVNLDNIHFSKIHDFILDAYKRGGVNTISWHLRNPYTGSSSWDVTSDKVVQSIIPGGEKHSLYTQWLDKVAAFMSGLRTDDGTLVPILFRPFHEHTGSWFWWGKSLCTKNDYIKLWQFTVEYLRDKKQIHNLIYIYSPDFVASKDEYFDRYPGDKYIDILGLDLYHRNGKEGAPKYISDVKNVMTILADYSKTSNKPFVFSETGLSELPIYDWFTNILYKAIEENKPAYVLVWRNAYEIPNHYYAPYPGHPVSKDFVKFKNMQEILFESELPNMYK